MDQVPAIAIVVPLLGATVVLATAPITGWRVRDSVGVAMAVGTLASCGWLTTVDGFAVSWMGAGSRWTAWRSGSR